jgi:hypothetical protein
LHKQPHLVNVCDGRDGVELESVVAPVRLLVLEQRVVLQNDVGLLKVALGVLALWCGAAAAAAQQRRRGSVGTDETALVFTTVYS